MLDGGPAGAGNLFLTCEDYKKFEPFETHTNFGSGAQILFRHKWGKLDTLLFFFYCVGALLIGMSFCNCGSGFSLMLSRIALLRKLLKLDSITVLTTNGLFGSLLLEYASFRPRLICVDWNLQESLNFFPLLTTSSFFLKFFEGYSGLFFKWLYFLARGFFNTDWWL